ncbi:MAG: hypothetical protein MJ050_07860 [Phascolarctobacterium sp.]|nr:hypothetical protein [Phascolarctobacterium sp.]
MKRRKSLDVNCPSKEEKVLGLLGKNWIMDQGIAEGYGYDAALALSYFASWHFSKKNTHRDFKDGHYWTYASVADLVEIYHCSTPAKMRAALDRLIDGGLLYENSFNKLTGDRTKWYALNENNIIIETYLKKLHEQWINKREAKVENRQYNSEFHKTIGENNKWVDDFRKPVSEFRTAIPNNNTNNNTNFITKRVKTTNKSTGLFSLEGLEGLV